MLSTRLHRRSRVLILLIDLPANVTPGETIVGPGAGIERLVLADLAARGVGLQRAVWSDEAVSQAGVRRLKTVAATVAREGCQQFRPGETMRKSSTSEA